MYLHLVLRFVCIAFEGNWYVGIFSDFILLYTFNSKLRYFYETFSSGTFDIEIFPGGIFKTRNNRKRCNYNQNFDVCLSRNVHRKLHSYYYIKYVKN
jgi:hypothetical protein